MDKQYFKKNWKSLSLIGLGALTFFGIETTLVCRESYRNILFNEAKQVADTNGDGITDPLETRTAAAEIIGFKEQGSSQAYLLSNGYIVSAPPRGYDSSKDTVEFDQFKGRFSTEELEAYILKHKPQE